MAITIFLVFVGFVLGLSFYLGGKTKSASGYFAAGGQIHWGVNGIAFAGDYLSAASFLGICGMIATLGYDGFLYSIGYLAGWIVALFVVAEPMKRLGKYTFADALDANFNSKGIQLAAGISTLVVSLFYLIPQMVGAGTLVTPLLNLDHHWGVIMVGVIVITIVATAGMTSTTYVQFIKGGLLVAFSLVITASVCYRGLSTAPQGKDEKGNVFPFYEFKTLQAEEAGGGRLTVEDPAYTYVGQTLIKDQKTGNTEMTLVKLAAQIPLTQSEDGRYAFEYMGERIHFLRDASGKIDALLTKEPEELLEINGVTYTHREIDGEKVLVVYTGRSAVLDGLRCVEIDGKLYAKIENWWKKETTGDGVVLIETQSVVSRPNQGMMINGAPVSPDNALRPVGNLKAIEGKSGTEAETGSVGPISFLAKLGSEKTIFNLWKMRKFADGDNQVTLYYPADKKGSDVMRPGQFFKVEGSLLDRIDFVSLMLALFLGTASLPHILIRYYTVPNPAAARKSTIVAIATIGFFYILTLYMGLGAAVNNVLNPADSNMSAPLLARSFGVVLFAIISAIAFATVLGTVSGLIVAASGAVAHDLLDRYCGLNMTEKQKVDVGKLAAVTVGLLAIILGIVFKSVNVSFLVGLAFAVAASANLPAIVMMLFWKGATSRGIVASIIVGVVTSVGLILFSPVMYQLYGLPVETAPVAIKSPAIISVPLSFLTLIIVSLMTKNQRLQEDPGL